MIYDEPIVFNAETRFNVLPKRLVDSFKGITTPNVGNVEVFRALNSSGVTVTDFLKGASGQSINIKGDGFTTIQNNTLIKTSTGADKLLSANLIYRFTNIDDVWYEDASDAGGGGGGGSGETNTASNLGSGTGLFAGKVGVDLTFKTLKVTGALSISSTSTEVTINGTGGGGGGSPGGADTNIQYNSSGSFAGNSKFIFNEPQNLVHLGPVGAVANNLAADTNAYISVSGTNAARDAGFVMSDETSNFTCMLFTTGSDNGLRFNYNYRQPYGSGFYGFAGSYSIQSLPQIEAGFESEGTFFVNSHRAASTAASTYDGLSGKTFKLYGSGQGAALDAGGVATEYVSLVSCQVTRGMELCVADGGPSTYKALFRIHGSGSSNPCDVYVGGAMKNIQIDGSGFLKGV